MIDRTASPWTTAGVLAITETVSWGVLYYTLPVLAVPIAEDLGASAATVTGALSVALISAGLVAPAVGAWIDRRGARGLMTLGSVVGVVAVGAWAATESLGGLYLTFAAVGLAMAMTLYEPAIAVAALYLGSLTRRAILAITVTAALASTIFSPLAAALAEAHGWRPTLLVLAAVLGVVTIPLHAAGLPRGAPPVATAGGPGATGESATGAATGAEGGDPSRGPFRRLAAVFAVEKAVATAVTAHVVAFLAERGATLGEAAAAAGMIGIAKIVGRAAVTVATRRHAATSLTTLTFALQATTLLAPFILPADRAVTSALLVAGFGVSSGAATVLWPLAILERFGAADFGRRNGMGALASTLPRAVAPGAVGVAVAATGGYTAAWLALAVFSGVAAACSRTAGAATLRRRTA